ncbi:hypothetical protein ACWFQ8_28525 [Streptomyces sp. NPDC055254]
MNVTRRPSASLATEHFDAETLALLAAVEVPLPAFANIDLDAAFGTPLEMYDLVTADELARWDAAAAVTKDKTRARDEVIAASGARREAARDILAADPSITELVARAPGRRAPPLRRAAAHYEAGRRGAAASRGLTVLRTTPGLRTRLLHPEPPLAAPDVGAESGPDTIRPDLSARARGKGSGRSLRTS